MVSSTTNTSISLQWDAVTGDPTLYGYEVLRSGTSGSGYQLVARVTTNNYNDKSVVLGATYYYVVRAIDNSFNRSGISNEVFAKAQPRTVTIVFTVTVPATTDGTGRAVYIAGTLNNLDGNLPQWDAAGVRMNRIDAAHWTITLTGKDGVYIEYKYVLGDWNYVEKDGSCGEIANRQLTLVYGSSGRQAVNDTVQNWRNVSPCGN
jgi:hypothetical protein